MLGHAGRETQRAQKADETEMGETKNKKEFY